MAKKQKLKRKEKFTSKQNYTTAAKTNLAIQPLLSMKAYQVQHLFNQMVMEQGQGQPRHRIV